MNQACKKKKKSEQICAVSVQYFFGIVGRLNARTDIATKSFSRYINENLFTRLFMTPYRFCPFPNNIKQVKKKEKNKSKTN